MSVPQDPVVVQPKSVDEIGTEFDSRKDLLTSLCTKTKSLMEECLEDAGIRFQSVQARVKSRSKLIQKYTDPQKNYARLDDITDLAALRVITYYEDEVDQVAELIRREFDIDPENSTDRREGNVDGFGYHAVNLVGRYSQSRSASVEYRKYSGIRFEIQITSILRHAWAEIEHDWYDLKEGFPPEIKRRFYRMAALLETAESEFLELRKKKAGYKRSIDVQIEANVTDIPINAISITSFIENEPLVFKIDSAIASILQAPSVMVHPGQSEMYSKVINYAGIKTVQDLKNALQTYEEEVIQYAELGRPYLVRPANAPLSKGASVFRLGLLLLARDDKTNLSQVLEEVGPTLGLPKVVDTIALSKIAQTVFSKTEKKD